MLRPQTMKRLTREQATEELRTTLIDLAGEDTSMCLVATRLGMFCGGFRGWSTSELRRRYAWLVRRPPGADRATIEEMANQWQLRRQQELGVPLCCDIQADPCETHRTCSSWEGFTDAQIATFHRELLGEDVEIGDDGASSGD